MIALFDSGYGGLTVLKPIIELLPEYDYLYLGDNARAPYGSHSSETIKKFCEESVEYLFNKGARLVIFACNAASSVALRHVQQKYSNDLKTQNKRILGVVIPTAEKIAQTTISLKVGLVATKATVNSKVYEAEIHKLNPRIKIFSKATPLLVPFIEEDWHHTPEAISVLKKYLRPFKSKQIDQLILGCTHYPLMIKDFRRIMGKKIHVLSSGETTAHSLKTYLQRHPELDSKLSRGGSRTYLTTDNPQKFKQFTEKHFGMKIKMPIRVDITPIQ